MNPYEAYLAQNAQHVRCHGGQNVDRDVLCFVFLFYIQFCIRLRDRDVGPACPQSVKEYIDLLQDAHRLPAWVARVSFCAIFYYINSIDTRVQREPGCLSMFIVPADETVHTLLE